MTNVYRRKAIHIEEHESVLTAIPEYHSGPGWSNYTVEVIIQDNITGRIRQEWLQPQEMAPSIATLFKLCAAAHAEFMSAMQAHVSKKRRKRGFQVP